MQDTIVSKKIERALRGLPELPKGWNYEIWHSNTVIFVSLRASHEVTICRVLWDRASIWRIQNTAKKLIKKITYSTPREVTPNTRLDAST